MTIVTAKPFAVKLLTSAHVSFSNISQANDVTVLKKGTTHVLSSYRKPKKKKISFRSVDVDDNQLVRLNFAFHSTAASAVVIVTLSYSPTSNVFIRFQKHIHSLTHTRCGDMTDKNITHKLLWLVSHHMYIYRCTHKSLICVYISYGTAIKRQSFIIF